MGAMRRAIVHVGMPRTASTTIQHVLAHHRGALERAGILYPDLTPASAAGEPHINHQHFGEALDGRRPRRERRALLESLDAQLAATAAETVLLSYEDWIQERRARGIALVLRDALARRGFRMEAIVVAKPQDEHLNSIYSHRAQLMREKRLFAGFCAEFEGSRRFAYAELIEPWVMACAGRVTGVPLRDRRSEAPLLHRFLGELGLLDIVAPMLAAQDQVRVENRSPGPVAVEVSRRLRLLRVPSRLSIRPRAAMRDIERAAFDRGLDAVPFKGVGPALRDRLRERYAGTNDRFARSLWAASWDDVVAPERPHPVNEIGGGPVDAATEAVVATLMAEALQRLGLAGETPWHAPVAEAAEALSHRLQRRFRRTSWRVI